MDDNFWDYENWPSGEPYDWMGGARGGKWDSPDFHLDIGCGKIKKGRIGLDHRFADGVNVVTDLDRLRTYAIAPEPGRDAVELTENGGLIAFSGLYGPLIEPLNRRGYVYPGPGEFMALREYDGRLPFPDNSIESIISHHALEHIGPGFLRLVDEIYRIMKPDAIFRAITPLFPSRTAVEDPDHKRYFMAGTWDSFCGTPGDDPQSCWLSSFSVPYTQARFRMEDKDITEQARLDDWWGDNDAREIRVALRAMKETA